MGRFIKLIFISVFLITALLSCTAPILIDTHDSEPVIVIYGCLTNEYRYQSVRITSSSPYFDSNKNEAVSDADVRIEDSEGNDYKLFYVKDGYYYSSSVFAVRPGITYKLTVNVDFDRDGDNEIYEAETTIPSAFSADSIEIKPMGIMGFRHFSLNIYLQDPVETNDFYLFKFFVNDSLSNDQISKFAVADDEMFNGEYLSGISVFYFEDATDEKVVEMNKNNDNAYMVLSGDIVRLQIINIEKGYYNFINECASEMRGENPMFGGPPSNISTNISNGAVGYFTGYCIRELTTVIP